MINYNQDFYGWTQEQSALLRAGRVNDIDIENLIEEIETMGRSERRELQSRLTVLLVHMLKWRHQPVRRGSSWELTIKVQRTDFQYVLADNPGLKSQLSDVLSKSYRLARLNAAKETHLDLSQFDAVCPWSLQQITDDAFFPD